MTVKKLIPEVEKLVNRPFPEKLLESQSFIARNAHIFKKPAIAFSGGKDSLAVVLLGDSIGFNLLLVFNNTGVEYPATVKYVTEILTFLGFIDQLIITKPEEGHTFWECADKFGLPRSKTAKGNGHGGNCCQWLKERPMKAVIESEGIDCLFTGVTAVENRNRMLTAKHYGACYYSKTWGTQRVHPILWWTEREVIDFIATYQIPLNPMYSKGCDRIGCAPCTAFKGWEAQLRQTNPKLYRFVKVKKDKQYVMENI